MKARITLVDNRFSLDILSLSRTVRKILKSEGAAGREIDIVYCRDREIIALNRSFKGKNRSTDVLAFDLSDGKSDPYLGEVYVNLQMARRQAGRYKVSYTEEVKRLTIHGVLHLLRFRDDTATGRARMWARQEEYMENGSNG
jgi:probable rRNA maturation factor